MKNRVKSLRAKQHLTQKELAERAKTSQQQIQRIETGSISTKLELAMRISEALGQPLEAVFPGAGKKVKGMLQEMEKTRLLPSDEELESIAEEGIEADVYLWTLKVLLRGHAEPLSFPLSAADKRRMRRVISREGSALEFFVFDSQRKRIALNLQEAMLCQLLFDPDFDRAQKVVPEKDDGDSGVTVYFAGSSVPYSFSADPDVPDEDGFGQLGSVFFYADSDPEPHERARFEDANGEEVWVRFGEIALLEVDLSLIESEEELEEEDEGIGA